jgi:hypothetical protein
MKIRKRQRKAEMPVEFDGLGNRHSEMRVIEVDNPHYSRVHEGLPGNPKTITAALNL